MAPRRAYGYMIKENLLAFCDLYQRYGIGSDSRQKLYYCLFDSLYAACTQIMLDTDHI
jgi:hypothetical protein